MLWMFHFRIVEDYPINSLCSFFLTYRLNNILFGSLFNFFYSLFMSVSNARTEPGFFLIKDFVLP